MKHVLSIIGAPSSAGAYAPGQELAPQAFRRHGLIHALSGRGWQVIDRGDAEGSRWRPDPSRPQAMNLEDVRRVADSVRQRVATALEADQAAIVLGGDCTVELGTVAGAVDGRARVGLVYIDFDADLNIPETSDGALDWTGVAHLLAIPGTAPELAGLGPRSPMLRPTEVLFLGVDNITAPEAETMRRLKLEAILLAEVKQDPHAAAARAAAWASQFDRILVHVDVDVLSFVDFPIAENTRRCDGLLLSELAVLLQALFRLESWRAVTITEVNPDHAPDEAAAFARFISVIADALP